MEIKFGAANPRRGEEALWELPDLMNTEGPGAVKLSSWAVNDLNSPFISRERKFQGVISPSFGTPGPIQKPQPPFQESHRPRVYSKKPNHTNQCSSKTPFPCTFKPNLLPVKTFQIAELMKLDCKMQY